MISLREGDAVRRRHPWDGTRLTGAPEGELLLVVKIYPCDTFALCRLSDGTTEFDFNLSKRSPRAASARFVS